MKFNKTLLLLVLIFLTMLFVGCSGINSETLKEEIRAKQVDDLYFKLSDGIYTLIRENFPDNFEGYNIGRNSIGLYKGTLGVDIKYEFDRNLPNDSDYSKNVEVSFFKFIDNSSEYKKEIFDSMDEAYLKVYNNKEIIGHGCSGLVFWFTNNTFDMIMVGGDDIYNSPVLNKLLSEFPIDEVAMNKFKEKESHKFINYEENCGKEDE